MLTSAWTILCQLSPWLLLGMLISGVMHVALPADYVRKKFTGYWGVVKAVAIGVPLPLCSCGVIPAGIGLKNEGANDGSSVGFLVSTPQTGIDSVLVSVAFFGWPFAIFKMVAALIMGVAGGWLTNATEDAESAPKKTMQLNIRNTAQPRKIRLALEHAFEIFRSFWIWLFIGIAISAAIEVWVPNQWFANLNTWGRFPSMLLVLLITAPLYVCATASVPMAAVLVSEGFPPSAALVFLMAGPATNATTIGAIFGRFGRRIVLIYLSVIIVGSLISGALLDWLLIDIIESDFSVAHHHGGWIESGAAIFVLFLTLMCIRPLIVKWWSGYFGAKTSR